VRLEEGDAGRVIAAVLEALEAVDEQRLRSSRTDVSDDPAHPTLLSSASPAWVPDHALVSGTAPEKANSSAETPLRRGRSTELSSNESRDRTTEVGRPFRLRTLGEDAHDGLRPRRAYEHSTPVPQLSIHAFHLGEQSSR